MSNAIRPRGHEPVSGRRTFPLSQIRVAAGQAISEGKALVKCDGGVITLQYHPFSRLAPNVEGDGFALVDEDATTRDDTDYAQRLRVERAVRAFLNPGDTKE
jgi:hypothetical protein